MAFVTTRNGAFIVKGYVGDNKTLLAFNFDDSSRARNLAGFTIFCKPPGKPGYYLWNQLRFQDPSKHAFVSSEQSQSTLNSPIQKYRWVHVTGVNHQGLSPATGDYVYTVTPRYFDTNHSMQALDTNLNASITVPVGPFKSASLSLGFTRGYMQSEAFVRHFGKGTLIQPKDRPLVYDTSAVAGTNKGQSVTFEQIYSWMGSTAREQVFRMLDVVVSDHSLSLRVFAYDLNEPDMARQLLKLAAQGRLRIVLDSASLHVQHTETNKTTGQKRTVHTLEDAFEQAFHEQAKDPSEILRGCFGRYSHDKVFIVTKNDKPIQVLTGSTNFSVNGLYVNANHVLVFDDPSVGSQYGDVFEESWKVLKGHRTPSKVAAANFANSKFAKQAFESAKAPKMNINFSPHTESDATKILQGICDRADEEAKASKGSVIFAVMQLTSQGNNIVYDKLSQLHAEAGLYSYGISDAPKGTFLYQAGSKRGVLVTGLPGQLTLPPPFNKVPTPPGHEIHDKFVVCGINGNDPVVYCGSSNLAQGGEQSNGDNLLEIHDADVATAFAIEALLLVDHYNFLDRFRNAKAARKRVGAKASSRSVKKTVSIKRKSGDTAGGKG